MSNRPCRPQSPALLLSLIVLLLISVCGCGVWRGQQLADHLETDVEVDVVPDDDGPAAEVAANDTTATAQADPDDGEITQRALGRMPDPLMVDMPPIPLRRVVPASSSANLVQQEDTETALPNPPATRPPQSPESTSSSKSDASEPDALESDALESDASASDTSASASSAAALASIVANAWPSGRTAPSSPTAEQSSDVPEPRTTNKVFTVRKIGSDEFQDVVLESDGPVIVDFYAQWCGPCKQLAPMLDEVARERRAVRVVKVNIDDDKKIARKYRIRSIPTVMVFESGKAVGRYTGLPDIRKGLNL